MKGTAPWVAVAVLLAFGVVSGCKSSTTPQPQTDGGADKAATDGTVACPNDDGVKNKPKGVMCTCDAQCASGFCADGFCCDKKCGEKCFSCGLATSLGTCTPTPGGLKPRIGSQCIAEDVGSCGLDGTCDGTGQCRKYESGTVCSPGTCENDAVTNTSVCDGKGQCKLGPSTVCAPFSCDTSVKPNSCFATCATNADCVSGRKCTAGSCGKKMNGALCPMGDSECASGHCADGVCCNTACGGACRSCNLVGMQGTCSPVSAGKGHPLCLQTPVETCGTTGVCDGFGTCSLYPASTPCASSTCSGATAMNTGRSCDGMGACQASEVQQCGNYKCTGNACISKCTTNADCADGHACVVATGSCGPKVDGQACSIDGDCLNQHCVDGVCCNTACTGACRSCALAGSVGKCTMSVAGAADPRTMCLDMGASTCGTDGKCDGAGGCRKYPAGTTVCAAETCTADVYTGPSTCNASGQCIKPNALACSPYHCNVNKCFTACTTVGNNTECIPPFTCGMNGNISSCGPKPPGSPCSTGTECASTFCAQGVCCNSACTNACQACNLPGTGGTCTNVASGVDPQNKCAVQAQSTCGTTGQCAAGQCARFAAGTQCSAASCATASSRAPAATCNGTGTCVAPATMNCAPGRCEGAVCTNTCTMDSQCTDPASCVNGSCGQQPKGGPCTSTAECSTGLTCYLREGGTGVCCNTACGGTCESCRLAGLVGTCSPVGAGGADPAGACTSAKAADPKSCGLNGLCAGNNTTSNSTGTARCQFYGATGQPSQGCRDRSCVNSTTTGGASTETAAGTCNGAGMCTPLPAAAATSCGSYKCLMPASGPVIQCATGGCTQDSDCVGKTCTKQTGLCGVKQTPGQACMANGDCDSNICAGGVCCTSACTPSDQCHVAGVCVMGTGACTNPTAPDTTACNDGMACTYGDKCTAGVCAGTTVTCANDTCNTRACNGTSTCTVTPNTGALCDDGMACTHTDKCNSTGTCVGTTITCTSDTCNTRTCNGTATCSSTPTTAPCNDGNMCTHTDTCVAGTCVGTAITCTSDTCNTRACNGTATCAVTPNTGMVCNDGMACTHTDKCNSSGTCVGTAITCTSDACNNRVCDGSPTCATTFLTGTCDDMNACTFADTCTAGTCVGMPITCADDECNSKVCNGTATCAVTPKDNGTTCTMGGTMCMAGVCQ